MYCWVYLERNGISNRVRLFLFFSMYFSQPQPICSIESLNRVVASREDDITYTVNVYIQPERFVSFSMEDRDASEFSLVLAGYHRLLTGAFIHVYFNVLSFVSRFSCRIPSKTKIETN